MTARASEPPRSVAVVVNPLRVDDRSAFERRIERAVADAGLPAPHWHETTEDDPGEGAARTALDRGADLVLVFGGDGTVNAVVSVLAGTDTALGILAGGTGNLLARNVGVPRDLDGALAVALGPGRRRIDVGCLDDDTGRTFAVMTGIGFDAVVMEEAPPRLKALIGWPAYLVAAARHLTDRHITVHLRIDGGQPVRMPARSVLIGNVGSLQGGVPLLPQAQPDDGLLDVAVVSPRNLLGWALLTFRVLTRRARPDRRLTWYTGRTIEVTTDRRHPREVDGDPIEAASELRVTVEPGALLLCVPVGTHLARAA